MRNGTLVVADSSNARIELFDAQGTFLEVIPVAEWEGIVTPEADAAINDAGTIWASSAATNSIVVYRLDGSLAGSLTPGGGDQLDQPSGLTLGPGGVLFVSNLGSNRIAILTQPNP